MRNQLFAYVKTKTPLFLLHGQYYVSYFLFQNFKLLAFFYDCINQSLSDLVGNHEDLFSRITAHFIVTVRHFKSCGVKGQKFYFVTYSFANRLNKISLEPLYCFLYMSYKYQFCSLQALSMYQMILGRYQKGCQISRVIDYHFQCRETKCV